ncbi:hypothetical protein [Dietzia cinnamea]|uniref:hypothetical protein n=1 Tax=Dietzia cinnamea TaxID=321318 RepID=UPI0021A3FA12|nr:hypothetical protein [Dietzia cinnamea]MCT2120892.1 hypothetical protein [Dietzia cinnamea]
MTTSDCPSGPSVDTDVLTPVGDPPSAHEPGPSGAADPEAAPAPAPAPAGGPGPLRRLAGLVLVIAPLVLAALWAVVGPTPQQEEAAPGAGGPLRSALSEASANSSFTVAGTEQLRSGSAELADGAGQLRDGSAELAAGMEQLQAGMGQAGTGADEVAGGVRQVVGAVRGVAVIQGQVSTAIEDALSRLRGDAPEVVQARNALIGLRDQLSAQGLDQNTLSNLDRLDSGAAELARQLSQPGADLRDGVYEATRGARELATGAGELSTGADALRDGAASVADSAGRTQDAIGRTGRALAAEQGEAAPAAAAAADDAQRRTSAGILGVAAAAVLGALLVQLVRRPGSSRAESVLALTLLTAGLSAWAVATADGLSAAGVAAVVAVVALVVVASSALWSALVAVLGAWPGRIVGALLAAASAGAAWWVWVAGGAPSALVTATSATTTGQATAALDALMLAGPAPVGWPGAAVLAAVAVCSLLAVRLAGRPRARR